MKNLEIVKSTHFGEVATDVYSNGKEMFMTINQLAACLGYASKSGVENILSRNEYLKASEFSSTHKVWVDEKEREARIFTEDGIYEVTMLAKTEKAKEFRAWVRRLLKSLRKGEAKIVGMTDYQRMVAKTRQENVRIRKAQILERLAGQYTGTYKQVLQAHATKELTGEFLLPLPTLEHRTYSATEIGEMVGISANMVGKLANRLGLKTDEYGGWFNDKSRHSAKEVQTFRYFDSVIEPLRAAVAEVS